MCAALCYTPCTLLAHGAAHPRSLFLALVLSLIYRANSNAAFSPKVSRFCSIARDCHECGHQVTSSSLLALSLALSRAYRAVPKQPTKAFFQRYLSLFFFKVFDKFLFPVCVCQKSILCVFIFYFLENESNFRASLNQCERERVRERKKASKNERERTRENEREKTEKAKMNEMQWPIEYNAVPSRPVINEVNAID